MDIKLLITNDNTYKLKNILYILYPNIDKNNISSVIDKYDINLDNFISICDNTIHIFRDELQTGKNILTDFEVINSYNIINNNIKSIVKLDYDGYITLKNISNEYKLDFDVPEIYNSTDYLLDYIRMVYCDDHIFYITLNEYNVFFSKYEIIDSTLFIRQLKLKKLIIINF